VLQRRVQAALCGKHRWAGGLKVLSAALNGLTGPVTVNGTTYNFVMPPMSQLNDDEIANILTFALNSWGNNGGVVSSAEVKAERASTKRTEGAAH